MQKDFIVLSGDALVDIPLEMIIDSHNLNESAVTVVLKELDLTQKAKLPAQKGEVETYDIFGLSEWSDENQKNLFGDSLNQQQRLVFKTNSDENKNMSLFVKASLLRKYDFANKISLDVTR